MGPFLLFCLSINSFDFLQGNVSLLTNEDATKQNIIKSFSIFGDRGKAIKMAIERFDDETRESFMSLYEKIDAGVGIPEGGAFVEESDIDAETPENE